MSHIDPQSAWAAVIQRDRTQDAAFVFAVTTTGIYCRPSCPARRPNRENVQFFGSGAEARKAHFRPCLRCRPDEASREAEALTKAIALIQASEFPQTLADLAAACAYSPAHFQRFFTRALGVSPAAYARALRMERARANLRQTDITDAIYASGYNSASGFYGKAKERLGMTPSAWAKGGAGAKIRWAQVTTSLGPMLVAASDQGICRLAFGVGQEDLAQHFPHATLTEGDEDFAQLLAQAVAAVENPAAPHDLPLDVRGTAFQEAIWQALRQIPKGETRSYAQLAAAIGRPKATRAAGSANGANRVAVLIPCHRVIRADGALGGYAWGEGIKRELLNREGVQTKE